MEYVQSSRDSGARPPQALTASLYKQDPYWEENTVEGLHEYARVLWNWRWLLLTVAMLGAVAAFAWSLTLVPNYVAETRIEIQDFNENFLNRREIEATTPSSLQTVDNYLQTQVEILQSDTLISRTVARLGLDRNPDHLALAKTSSEKWLDTMGLRGWLNSMDVQGRPSLLRRLLNIPLPDSTANMSRAIA